jgi:3D (Asp-Asp-Asp) domain-containing protein
MKRVLSQSASRKIGVMLLACAFFVLLYEATTFDSREAAETGTFNPAALVAGQQLLFSATAYCKGTTTASGAAVRTGIAASDPTILPVGSVVNVTTNEARYNGVYTIMDTGPAVQGRILDLYMWSCHEALKFGRKDVSVQVLRLGWNPTNSSPSLVDRLFRRREAARQAVPPPPPPTDAPIPETAIEPPPPAAEAPAADTDVPPVAPTSSTATPLPTGTP